MDAEETTYLHDAGALLAFGLRATARPATEPFYRVLLTRYQDDTNFRHIVTVIAEGMGLQVVGAGGQGMALAPTAGSVFAMKWNDYRSQSPDDRLIDGLIFIAIMTTLFPRSEDLEEDPMVSRPSITVEEVEQLLRGLCQKLEVQARQQPDISAEDDRTGLFDAWRAYLQRPIVTETSDNRRSPKAIHSLIEKALDFLSTHGCFIRHGEEYQATWRYRVLVQEFSAEPLYALVQDLLKGVEKGLRE